MISGVLTVYPKFGKETYVESKTKMNYRHLPAVTADGINLYITITEEMYDKYIDDIMCNNWDNTNPFRVWGEIRSVNETTEGFGLSNLYLRVELMIPEYSNKNVNLFSINAHGTKTNDLDSSDSHNMFYIAANKAILNQKEKRNKPSYGYLQTPKNEKYLEKDIVQGNVKLAEVDGELVLKSLHTVGFTSCRKLAEAFLPEFSVA